VLAAPRNSAHTAPSLRLLLTGCVEGPDLNLQRQCFAILQRLVELWVGSIPGFEAYVLNEVLPVCFSAPAQPHFSLKNAAALPLLESSAALQKAILAEYANAQPAATEKKARAERMAKKGFFKKWLKKMATAEVVTIQGKLVRLAPE